MPTKSFEDLEVWKRAHEFVLAVYKFTETFPKTEVYGLTSQFRRAAISIPANIAEGYGKFTKPDKIKFYGISYGSLEECRYYLILAQDLGYGETALLRENLDEVARMLSGYISAIRNSM